MLIVDLQSGAGDTATSGSLLNITTPSHLSQAFIGKSLCCSLSEPLISTHRTCSATLKRKHNQSSIDRICKPAWQSFSLIPAECVDQVYMYKIIFQNEVA